MGSSKAIVGLFVLTASAAFAQEPPAITRDDVNATMGVLSPDADNADDIVRKIPRAKSKRTGKSTDAPAKDLANPGKDEPVDSGSPDGPGTSTPPETPSDPGTPTPHGGGDDHGGGNGPDVGGAPDPREQPGHIGRDVSEDVKHRGKDARHHHDAPPASPPKDKPKDKPPRGPGSKPPDPSPPGPRNPGPKKPPDVKPPHHPPRVPHPPRPG
jgi:hypothetical protein